MHNAKPIFAFLTAAAGAALPTALVTVIAVTGASTRNPGSHMAVAGDRSFAGSLSGGCIEAAVVSAALEAIADGQPRIVRFGAGSPIIDIRLPCGGSIDLLITPLADGGLAAAMLAKLTARQPAHLTLPMPGGGGFAVTHRPNLRLAIIGHGASVRALHAQASAYGADTLVVTPDAAICADAGGDAILLRSTGDRPDLAIDAWTAAIFLFHDHDWEGPLLAQVLAAPGFFTGAMGSRATHAARCAALAARGVGAEAIAGIVAPIGLIPSSRDPETLALSILAQVVDRYHRLIAADMSGANAYTPPGWSVMTLR